MARGRCCDMAGKPLHDILLCLPVMSLLRFKAVCKYWFSIIESPTFIWEHIGLNRDNKEDALILHSDKEIVNWKFALLTWKEKEACLYNIDTEQLWHSDSDVCLLGYCGGIFCLTQKGSPEITLWNPALKQVRSLPQPLSSDKLVPRDNRCCWTNIAFGIDVKRNDYKLVAVMFEYSGLFKKQVAVCNLGGDNSWKIIHKNDVLPFDDFRTTYALSSCKSGKCFWIAREHHYYDDDNIEKQLVLLSFDFSDDVFRAMLLPPHKVHCHPSALDLLDDKVVCIMQRFTFDTSSKKFEIWMLHEFGVEKSWNLICKIGPLSDYHFVVPGSCFLFSSQISKSGELLLCDGSEGKDIFHLYNLHTKQRKYHPLCNLKLYYRRIIRYNASLFPLKSMNDASLTE